MIKIDELMAIISPKLYYVEGTWAHKSQCAEIRSALEAALKPGEPQIPQAWLWQFSDGDWHDVPFATQDECEDECAGYNGKAHPLFLAAPPAQTPPLKQAQDHIVDANKMVQTPPHLHQSLTDPENQPGYAKKQIASTIMGNHQANATHIATANPATVLEIVSMIRQRDAVLNRVLTLLGPEAPACSGCAAEWEMAIAAIKEVLG